MKKMNLILCCFALCGVFTACNSGTDTGTSTTSTSSTTDSSSMSTNTTASAAPASTTPAASKTPLGAADSAFMMKAAMGGMMEVSAGTAAQSNAVNDRVKANGSMMVTDHTKANTELMALASSKGVTLPAALPADQQKHLDDMAKMKGKAFDSHYISMMMNDHKKDIAEFEKEANSGMDADLKAWAAKTLPTLKMHRDSVQALAKMKM